MYTKFVAAFIGSLLPSNLIFRSIVESTSRPIAQDKKIWRHKLKGCGDRKDRRRHRVDVESAAYKVSHYDIICSRFMLQR